MNYYNDNDKSCCAWLRELIKDGLIPKGDVDGRSIAEVQPEDLRQYDQCHFFAGIGGWSLALKLAGWEGPCWTGSCPCQPFSVAGKGKGEADERHLWPAFFKLIKECHPGTVFGEQVEGAVRLGWLDGVFADLEGEDYSCGAAVLGAHSIGAPHIRQRLYWVGYAQSRGETTAQQQGQRAGVESASDSIGLAKPKLSERGKVREGNEQHGNDAGREETSGRAGARSEDVGRLANAPQRGQRTDGSASGEAGYTEQREQDERLADRLQQGLEGHAGDGANGDGQEREIQKQDRPVGEDGDAPGWNGPCVWWPCRDGVRRRIPAEPSLFPLAHGVPGRVGLLRGAGNAIIPPLAAEFVKAFMESVS